MQRLNVLLCCTGSVASIKIPRLYPMLSEFAEVPLIFRDFRDIRYCERLLSDTKVRIVATEHSLHFFQRSELPVYTDDQEWSSWQKRGDKVISRFFAKSLRALCCVSVVITRAGASH